MTAYIEDRIALLETRVPELQTTVDSLRYTTVVLKLMVDNGWTAEEATTNFNNLLNSLTPAPADNE